jgi:simple sugar transport system ATP-binding protein
MPEALLEVHGLEKQFPGVRALDGVDFTVRHGEIHALMGENGAGKSTLIKTLTGVYQRDGGTIRLDGKLVDADSPKAAEALGISTVYQEVNLVPHLSVAENICLGREPLRFGMIRWGEVRRRAETALARLEMMLDVTREVSSYSVAIQQMVAIARALDVDAKLLILDEPTASLDEGEVEELFSVLRKLREQGLGIIFVTHFLDQVYAVSDRITIFRDGRLVGEYETANLPRAELVSCMIGKQLATVRPVSDRLYPDKDEAREKAPFVAAKHLGRAGSMAPFDLNIAPGEVVGLAGLLGSGRTEIARLLFGVDKADTGTIEVNGKLLKLRSPRQAIDAGFAFTPENRKVEGIIPHLSVRENIILAMQAKQGMWNKFSYSKQVKIADHFIRALNIKTPGPEQPVRNLSGGNQQKVLLARWLANKPRFLILDEPTRGIDVGAKAEIEKLIGSLRTEGMAILFICSELEELVRTCERVAVLRDRTKVGELSGQQVEEDTVMHTIAGGAATAGDKATTGGAADA